MAVGVDEVVVDEHFEEAVHADAAESALERLGVVPELLDAGGVFDEVFYEEVLALVVDVGEEDEVVEAFKVLLEAAQVAALDAEVGLLDDDLEQLVVGERDLEPAAAPEAGDGVGEAEDEVEVHLELLHDGGVAHLDDDLLAGLQLGPVDLPDDARGDGLLLNLVDLLEDIVRDEHLDSLAEGVDGRHLAQVLQLLDHLRAQEVRPAFINVPVREVLRDLHNQAAAALHAAHDQVLDVVFRLHLDFILRGTFSFDCKSQSQARM